MSILKILPNAVDATANYAFDSITATSNVVANKIYTDGLYYSANNLPYTGIYGATGVAGADGATGSQGASGVGATGPTGTNGATGSAGTNGATGEIGLTGATGTAGATGVYGASGINGNIYNTTSNSSLTIASTGATGIVVGTYLDYTVGQSIIIAYDYDNHMHAEVISYNQVTGSLELQRTSAQGSGAYTSWEVNLDGAVGQAGATGVAGVGGTVAHYGDFYSSTPVAVAAAGTNLVIPIDSTRSNYGVSIQNNGASQPTRITFAETGTYEISVAARLVNAAAQPHDAHIFIKKNDSYVADSTLVIGVPSKTGGTNGQATMARTFVVPYTAGDYIELWANFDSTDLTLEQHPAHGVVGATGYIPASPPVEVSVTQVTYTLIGASGSTGLTGASGANGATGTSGANGATGPAGSNGTDGATGTAGSNGTNGATGVAGTNGATGTSGANGATGSAGANGATGPQATTTTATTAPSSPNVGDFWYDTDTDVLLRYTNDGTSNNWIDITGPIFRSTYIRPTYLISANVS